MIVLQVVSHNPTGDGNGFYNSYMCINCGRETYG